MQLPAKLLGRVRVGVGVGAVLLGGCDVVAEVQASTVEPALAEANQAIEAKSEAPAQVQAAPQPLLMSRPVAQIVEATARGSETASASEPAPESGVFAPAISDLGRVTTPEGERAFVPYADGTTTIALSTPVPVPPKPRPRASTRPVTEPAPLAIDPMPRAFPGVDEPCDPQSETTKTATTKTGIGTIGTPKSGWSCPACGRG